MCAAHLMVCNILTRQTIKIEEKPVANEMATLLCDVKCTSEECMVVDVDVDVRCVHKKFEIAGHTKTYFRHFLFHFILMKSFT